jgi:hypothetical protein
VLGVVVEVEVDEVEGNYHLVVAVQDVAVVEGHCFVCHGQAEASHSSPVVVVKMAVKMTGEVDGEEDHHAACLCQAECSHWAVEVAVDVKYRAVRHQGPQSCCPMGDRHLVRLECPYFRRCEANVRRKHPFRAQVVRDSRHGG